MCCRIQGIDHNIMGQWARTRGFGVPLVHDGAGFFPIGLACARGAWCGA